MKRFYDLTYKALDKVPCGNLRGFLVVYDLHCHSNVSDGSLSPEELVLRAKDRGVSHLGLTDHDTVEGIARASDIAKGVGLTLVPGIEFSTQWLGSGVHVVGLNIDPKHSALTSTVLMQAQTRVDRAVKIGERLAKIGILNAYEGACEIAKGVVGRPHFARYLIDQGHVKSINAAFKKYLGAGKPGDVPLEWVEMPAIIESIEASGGIAVLAHPGKYKLTRTKLRRLVDYFKAHGGRAMEVVSGQQTANETRCFADIAEQYKMYASCGSDFHLPGQPWQELGSCAALPQQCKPVWTAFA